MPSFNPFRSNQSIHQQESGNFTVNSYSDIAEDRPLQNRSISYSHRKDDDTQRTTTSSVDENSQQINSAVVDLLQKQQKLIDKISAQTNMNASILSAYSSNFNNIYQDRTPKRKTCQSSSSNKGDNKRSFHSKDKENRPNESSCSKKRKLSGNKSFSTLKKQKSIKNLVKQQSLLRKKIAESGELIKMLVHPRTD